jgi:hypothetical protein
MLSTWPLTYITPERLEYRFLTVLLWQKSGLEILLQLSENIPGDNPHRPSNAFLAIIWFFKVYR